MANPELTLVHSDSRGELYSILLPTGQEVMLLHSVAGSRRGGHSHNVAEDVMILSGRMRYWKLSLENGAYSIEELGPGTISSNAPGQAHMGEFWEDTWLLEIKHAKKGEWTQANYPPWRSIVERRADVDSS